MLAEIRQGRTRWRAAVAGVLTKTTRVDRADLPTEPERLLDSSTYEGLSIRPLYTALDALPELPLPGVWPFVRGGQAHRDVIAGWKVAEVFPSPEHRSNCDGADCVGGNLAEANNAVLTALTQGVSALVLRVGPDGGVAAEEVARLLDGVYLELVPIIIDAGAQFRSAAEAILALIAAQADGDEHNFPGAMMSIDMGADPLTALISGCDAATMDDVISMATAVAGRRGMRTITVDGSAFHHRGANAVWELAGIISAGVGYLRILIDAGMNFRDALSQISFRVIADDDQFMTIAKFRAVRLLWARVAQVMGEPDCGGAVIHGLTSLPMMTQRDPWVNMLRTTLAAFGAGIGGADTVAVRPFDVAIPGGLHDSETGFARRIARNTQLLLLEEAHVGRVLDPAGGAWYIENLTENLAAQAWSHFQEVESYRNFSDATSYIIQQIERVRARRDDDIAYRRTLITGVSEFPNLAENLAEHNDVYAMKPDMRSSETLSEYRYASAFEALRYRSDVYLQRTGKRPSVLLLPLGAIAEHAKKVTYVSNLLVCGGIEAINSGTVMPTDIAEIVRSTKQDYAVVCGSEAQYRCDLADIISAARAAGIRKIYVAGSPERIGDITTELTSEVKPDGYLAENINAVEVLSVLLEELEA